MCDACLKAGTNGIEIATLQKSDHSRLIPHVGKTFPPSPENTYSGSRDKQSLAVLFVLTGAQICGACRHVAAQG